MSSLRRADYTHYLKGKTITRVEWTNDKTEHFICLSLFFDDKTLCTFRLTLTVDEEAELSDFIDGNISNERPLLPLPYPPIKLEGE